MTRAHLVPVAPLALLALLALLAPARVAAAHPLAPLALSVEQHGEEVTATLKRSRVQPRGAAFAARFPKSCEALSPFTVTDHESFALEHHALRCDGSLVGAQFGIDGLSEANLDALVRVTLDDGRVLRGLLDRSSDGFVVPERTTALDTMKAFGRSGILHLLEGLDHVLFVVGVVLLLRRPRHVLIALTAFTVGHGLSMCAATLGWIDLPSRVAEAAIAATLIWLAWEIVQRGRDEHDTGGSSRDLRRPYLAAVGVGLVHGLGFAAAFSEAGVTGPNLPLALIAFHMGIELGQVAVVVAALIALRAVSGARSGLRSGSARGETLRLVAGYAIGSLAFMWLVERALFL